MNVEREYKEIIAFIEKGLNKTAFFVYTLSYEM